ncbi:Carbamoyl-phosphate synthase small chain [Pseudomonas syringae pv. atrofaciens]|uniref:Carbamoyl phosphate synthase small chain n=1 Tax=Pseudomonas syringae pv. atrofaciens TaxID=192087 RepID=A0AAD0IEI3_PSESX|nr:glutamine-hydrolyzing carbamoyl-phosphate synthase small subunit [Pseudomonas syringae]AVX26372.1 carbamoyl-phosphate synthase small subunit [Pseudomonas syringae pv. atrofaciens]KPW08361.1 Carbamoyl-phosphate synthase small chain [Pseudomonas syringae pv. atrofaciens]
MTKPAILALADGSIFRGEAIGADGQTVGEVVFNTAMTGYQEILTDPSYAQQIVTLTYPHIGNTGTTPEDAESNRVWSAGLVIRDLPLVASNWRNKLSLGDYLKANNVVAIAGIDTRRLTRILREKGAQNGCILAGDNITEEAAIAAARSFPGLKGMDLAKEVCTEDTYEWRSSVWDLKTDSHPEIAASELPYHVVAYDYGVKVNILRMLVERGCRVTVVPAQTPASEVLAYKPDGVFLSNGPGDPEPCDYAIKAIREVLETDIPVFGICLGHQLLALAAGAKTVKMGHGHHGANHPVQDLDTRVVMITSQNHGFAVDEATLPSNVRAIHKSLFDGTLQGIELTDKSAFSFQGHPEASPGPNDVAPLFDRFIEAMAKRR